MVGSSPWALIGKRLMNWQTTKVQTPVLIGGLSSGVSLHGFVVVFSFSEVNPQFVNIGVNRWLRHIVSESLGSYTLPTYVLPTYVCGIFHNFGVLWRDLICSHKLNINILVS